MQAKEWKKELFTIPNLLSLFRLLLIPVYIVLYLNAQQPQDYFVAAAILAVSCLTDLIDGKIARHFGMISKVGRLLDPLADKATQLALMVCLTIKYPVLITLAILFVLKEGWQTIAFFVFLRKGLALNGAMLIGKLCTTVLFTSLIVLVLFPNIGDIGVYIIMGIDIAFLLASFVIYAHQYHTRGYMVQRVEDFDKDQ